MNDSFGPVKGGTLFGQELQRNPFPMYNIDKHCFALHANIFIGGMGGYVLFGGRDSCALRTDAVKRNSCLALRARSRICLISCPLIVTQSHTHTHTHTRESGIVVAHLQ